jgi:DNA/RNA-binding domain of Phe-tRNA-synthetase-like protein
MFELEIDKTVGDLTVGVVSAQSVTIGPASEALRDACKQLVRKVREQGMADGDSRREAVRQMIRAGGFKPSGRNKPAQEYLLRTANEAGELPTIFNVVDWINAISLSCGLPISLLSAKSLGNRVVIRYGKVGEKFIFNRSGQELELEGLICVCAAQGNESMPLGTPIKDSMAGKVTEADTDIVTLVYAPSGSVTNDEIVRWCEELARGFRQYCGAKAAEQSLFERKT